MLFSRLRNLFSKEKDKRLAIIDSVFPQSFPFGFRNFEINGLLEAFPTSLAYGMHVMKPGEDAWFLHSYGCKKSIFKRNLSGYLRHYPNNKGRIHYLPKTPPANLSAYSYFLAETYTLLPYFETHHIPFVFILYPGGGFGLDNDSSDRMLRRIFNSPFFRKVIVTLPVTRDYLKKKNFCPSESIENIISGYIQFSEQEILPKKYYPKDKSTIDVCFAAPKYSPRGIDKGYDLFIEAAKMVAPDNPHVRFHVVGGFDETDMPMDGLEGRVTFYGLQRPDFLKNLYSTMDIYLAPCRPGILFPGNFDGFPMGSEAMFCGVALLTTDELGNNEDWYVDNQDLVIIRPNLADIVGKLRNLIRNPEAIYRMGESGSKTVKTLMEPKKQLRRVVQILQKGLDLTC